MWGIATLLGPAVGGVFAEFGVWRAAFWSLIPVTLVFTLLAIRVLPEGSGRAEEERAGAPGVPLLQLVLLTAAVIAASVGSVTTCPIASLVNVGVALIHFALFL